MRKDYFTPTYVLDRFLTYCRYNRVLRMLSTLPHVHTVYDFGCGSGKLVELLIQKGYDAYGIDVKSSSRIFAADLNKPLPLSSSCADVIISLANIEHLSEPLVNLQEIYRILNDNGMLILTTPSTAAKPVLEFLAFTLKWIDPFEIEDHKRYFSKKLLTDYLHRAGFSRVHIKRFQCGMNLHALARK